jgi:hypothetical protein
MITQNLCKCKYRRRFLLLTYSRPGRAVAPAHAGLFLHPPYTRVRWADDWPLASGRLLMIASISDWPAAGAAGATEVVSVPAAERPKFTTNTRLTGPDRGRSNRPVSTVRAPTSQRRAVRHLHKRPSAQAAPHTGELRGPSVRTRAAERRGGVVVVSRQVAATTRTRRRAIVSRRASTPSRRVRLSVRCGRAATG